MPAALPELCLTRGDLGAWSAVALCAPLQVSYRFALPFSEADSDFRSVYEVRWLLACH